MRKPDYVLLMVFLVEAMIACMQYLSGAYMGEPSAPLPPISPLSARSDTASTAPAPSEPPQVTSTAMGDVGPGPTPTEIKAAKVRWAYENSKRAVELKQMQRRLTVEIKYAELTRRLQLPPSTETKLLSLLLDKESLDDDINASFRKLRAQFADPKLVNEARANARMEIEASIKSLLGDARYSQYLNFESHASEYALVTSLRQQFATAGAPLSEQQVNDVLNTLLNEPEVMEQTNLFVPVSRSETATVTADGIGYCGLRPGQVYVSIDGDITVNRKLSSANQYSICRVLYSHQFSIFTSIIDRQKAQASIAAELGF